MYQFREFSPNLRLTTWCFFLLIFVYNSELKDHHRPIDFAASNPTLLIHIKNTSVDQPPPTQPSQNELTSLSMYTGYHTTLIHSVSSIDLIWCYKSKNLLIDGWELGSISYLGVGLCHIWLGCHMVKGNDDIGYNWTNMSLLLETHGGYHNQLMEGPWRIATFKRWIGQLPKLPSIVQKWPRLNHQYNRDK